MIELSHRFRIEAAHRLPHAPPGHKCRRLHGHSFEVDIEVGGEPQEPQGWLVDFAELADAFEPLRRQLDHSCLNDVDGLDNPTSENLARWIFWNLAPKLDGLRAVTVAETCQVRCRYTPSAEDDRGR